MGLYDEVEIIKSKANIVDIIASYLPLTQHGKNYFGVCPFHEDHSPSMSVSSEKQIFKCFSCGASGNVFTFVSDYENISFIEAVKLVAEKCGLTFNGSTKTKNKTNNKLEYEIMSLALKFYQNNLNTQEGKKAKEYLKSRYLDEFALKEFDIGLALNNSLGSLLVNKNYSQELLESLGLINQNGDFLNDVFQNRIIFPIHDLEGNVIGFTGRIYEDSNQAKYINSKETTIFKKGDILFNYHRAKTEIKKQHEVIIVEGNMDALRLSLNGVKNVVALMGTSLTSNQIKILKDLRAKIILMLDNDDAGEIGTFTNGKILEEAGLTPFIIRLSGEKDPDSYILKEGIKGIEINLKNPLTFLDFKLKYFQKNRNLTKTEDLVAYTKDIINSLKDINDDLTRELTLKKFSTDYDIPLNLLESELAKVKEKPKKEIPKVLPKKVFSKYDKVSSSIIYFMLNDINYIKRFQKEIGYFPTKKYRDIVNSIIYFFNTYQSIDMASFLNFIGTEEELLEDVKEILKIVDIKELNDIAFKELVIIFNQERIKEDIKNLKEQIINELDANKKIELANKLIELKKGCVGK